MGTWMCESQNGSPGGPTSDGRRSRTLPCGLRPRGPAQEQPPLQEAPEASETLHSRPGGACFAQLPGSSDKLAPRD